MKESPSLLNQAKAVFIGKIFSTLIQILTPVLLVRIISQNDYGIFRQYMLIAQPTTVVLGLGYATSLYYFFPTTNSIGKAKIIQQTQFLFLVNCILMAVGFLIFQNQILEYFDFEHFKGMIPLLILYVSFMLLSSIIEIIFTLEKELLLNKIYFPIERIVRFVILLIILMIIPDYKGPIIAITIFAGLRFVFLMFHIRHYYKRIFNINWDLLKDQLMYSMPFGIAIFLNMVSGTYDKFLVNNYINAQEFAVYAVSFFSIPFLSQFFSSIHNVVMPEISLYMKDGKLDEATNLWRKTVDKTSSLAIPVVLLFWIVAEELITILYTIEYRDASKYYRVYILVFLVSMFSHNIILRGSKKTKLILVSSVIGTLLTIVLGTILVPRYYLNGAVLTGIVGIITPMIISLNFERIIMGLSISNWVNWKQIFTNFCICLIVGIPILLLKDKISNIYIRSFLMVSIYVILVVYLQIKFKLFLFENILMEYIERIRLKIRT